jgi:ribosomal protein S18 acetylase RimI-like enzyme
MAESFTLRPAAAEDAGVLADLGRRTFTETFADSNTAEDLRLFLDETYSEALQARELAEPDTRHLLLEAEGVPAGFARLRRGAVPDCVAGPDPVELQRIYVLRAWHGLKAGPALLERCLGEARALGGRTLWLGVWERNERAQAFYRRHGFETVGDHVFTVGTDPQRDVIMVRSLP